MATSKDLSKKISRYISVNWVNLHSLLPNWYKVIKWYTFKSSIFVSLFSIELILVKYSRKKIRNKENLNIDPIYKVPKDLLMLPPININDPEIQWIHHRDPQCMIMLNEVWIKRLPKNVHFQIDGTFKSSSEGAI